MMKNEQTPPITPNDNAISPSTFRPACEFRWCYYLHLNTAKQTSQKWHERSTGESHPVFEVEGKRRLVFVRGYFDDERFHGDRWCLIYQVTTKDKLGNGKKKPNLKRLGNVLPWETRPSFIQTISERYPVSLIEQAGKESPFKPDPMTSDAIRRIVESITYRSGAVS